MRPALIRRGWSWGLAASVAALLFATASGQAQQRAGGAPAASVSADRGKYLVNITGCHDCHSPKSQGMTPDPTRLLSGRPSTTKIPTKPDGEVHASLDLTAWFGTTTGVARLSPDGQFAYRQGKRWLPDDHVTNILAMPDGSAWVATKGGVAHLTTQPMTFAQKAAVYEEDIE